jgi:basic amino acid/polyamine antiporter, APA family
MTLIRTIDRRQLFAIAFGAIIGVAWIAMLGTWLATAGSLGAVLAFALGGASMLTIGLCYAEAASRLPAAGGSVAYAYAAFGVRASFVVGWFIALAYVAVVPFKAIFLGWVIDVLIPGFAGPVLYRVLGQPVHLISLLLGLSATLIIAWINYRGVMIVARFQLFGTYALIALSFLFVITGIVRGNASNLVPYFSTPGTHGAVLGVLALLGTVPFWFAGFDSIPQAMEERNADVSPQVIARVIVWAIAAAFLFYAAVIVSCAMVLPRERLLRLDLPASSAFQSAFGSHILAKLVLLCGLLGILTGWNAMVFCATRVLFAMGRARMLPSCFGALHVRYATPANAVLFVCGMGLLGTLLGRGAISPIVNAAGAIYGFVFFVVSVGVLRLRRSTFVTTYRMPGQTCIPVIAAIASAAMVVIALQETYRAASGALPIEWAILLGWLSIGCAFWLLTARTRNSITDAERMALMRPAAGAATFRSTESPGD